MKLKEWDNPYNSFNSWKGLLYAPWYQAIKDWRDGKRQAPLPPVEASLDPIHACNLMCEHCNAHKYLTGDSLGDRRITDEHMDNLIDFLGRWGVKAICFGGGGEPTMHTHLTESLYRTKARGMESSIATNGTLFDDKLIKAMASTCRWVGISIDASTPKTYKIGRNADLFDKATENIKKLVDEVELTNSKCDIAFKFLIFDYNQNEIYEACKLAKELGVNDFHARPADMSHQGMGEFKDKAQPYDIEIIKEQFTKCHELEDKDFHVYTIMHKFDDTFKPKKDFSQCYASPCCIQLCSNGSVYLCPDQRHTDDYKLGEHYPNPKNILNFWGKDKHYNLVFNYGREKCNTRCTFNPYCKQAEELFMKDTDPMCWKFI